MAASQPNSQHSHRRRRRFKRYVVSCRHFRHRYWEWMKSQVLSLDAAKREVFYSTESAWSTS